MAKYRKKPVEIEAFKWTGDREQSDDPIWIVEAIKNQTVWFGVNDNNEVDSMFINTLEGVHKADIGDYIIKGVKGELYPCKPDIFEMTYDEVIEIYTEGNI